MATALAGRDQGQDPMPPLEDASMNPVNAAVGGQEIGDQHGDAEEVSDSRANDHRPTKSNRSVGSRQQAARRRAWEKAAAPAVNNRHAPLRPQQDANRRNAIPVESSSTHGGGLRMRLDARRGKAVQLMREEELAVDNKALAEKMARLEKQIRSRLNNFEQVVGKVAEAVNVDAKMYTSYDHPFIESIIRVPLPDKYKSPPIPLYDGRSDPDDHLEVYTGHMVLHGYPEEVMCRAFRNHLFDLRGGGSGVKKYIPPKQNLSRVYQGPNEPLKDWIARFREQVTATEGISDEVALMGALSSMKKDIPYSTDLDRRPLHTYQEFLTRAQGFINAEEAKKALKSKVTASAKEEVEQASSQNNSKKRQAPPQVQAEQRYNPAPSNRGGNASTSQGENKRPKPQWNDAYTPLTMGIEDVYHEINHLQGRLSEYQADRRNNNNRRNNDRREEQRHDNPPEPVGVIRTIFGGPYLSGTSRRAQKEYAGEAKEKFSQRIMNVFGREAKAARYEDAEITFSEADARGVHFLQSDALVIEAMIGNHTVCRILVDNGSSVDILYSNCLDKMGIPRARLQNSAQPLYGFTGDSVIPEEAIELPMTIGDRPHTSTVMSKFLVVKGGDQYNAVIGRPTLRALRAVTSIYY
ncbi:uncharacterized protein LOC112091911 [Morus notabilis]|uniref:uncharacterized protein LOC112091911 n=1 Tax=Morus notabilis TaxID=981085 RepID=UPI000CED2632|nr:uncharacterized protein LOC112091911 [Morus notabilis]